MSGNGVDLGHIAAMLGDVMKSQDGMGVEMTREFTTLRLDVTTLKRDMSGVKHDLAALRQTVAEYHATVLGHGMLISELDERLRRVEQHLGLPPVA